MKTLLELQKIARLQFWICFRSTLNFLAAAQFEVFSANRMASSFFFIVNAFFLLTGTRTGLYQEALWKNAEKMPVVGADADNRNKKNDQELRLANSHFPRVHAHVHAWVSSGREFKSPISPIYSVRTVLYTGRSTITILSRTILPHDFLLEARALIGECAVIFSPAPRPALLLETALALETCAFIRENTVFPPLVLPSLTCLQTISSSLFLLLSHLFTELITGPLTNWHTY